MAEAAESRAKALEASLRGRRRRGPRTLTLIWKEPWMSAGPDTYVGDLLRHQAELQKRFPEAEVRLVDGRALTWYLSRTEEGLELVRSL